MFRTKFQKTIVGVGLVSLVAAALLVGCGDTDGGAGNDDVAQGTQYVSDGGAGATLELGVRDDHINVGEETSFWIWLKDPQGAPLPWIRLFCESEHGIAIIEPSRGGVAFEHTNQEGLMSGRIGGLAPGSYILECRAPEGFNLVDRVQVVVRGEIPDGFQGWPGAAGGNLGGGSVQQPEGAMGMVVNINAFPGTTAGSVPHIDLTQETDCDGNPTTNDPEPYGYDDYSISITNGRTDTIFVESVHFTVNDGSGVRSTTQFNSMIIEPEGTAAIQGPLTDGNNLSNTVLGNKIWAGTNIPLSLGAWSVTFTVRGVTATGDSWTSTASEPITAGYVNNCE